MDNSRAEGNRPITVFFALTVLICAMLMAPAGADTLPPPDRVYVNASYNETTPDYGSLNFSSIQLAVENVTAGGEVWVHNGTYQEALVIDKSVNVTTISHLVCPGLKGTTLDALGGPIGVEITASDVSFSGFEVVNASRIGIYAHDADAVAIVHNSVSVFNESHPRTFGVGVRDGNEIQVCGNEVRVIGNSTQIGIGVEGIVDACIHDNDVVTVSWHSAADVDTLVDPAFVLKEDEPFLDELFLDEAEDASMMEPCGILLIEGTRVTVEGNRVGAIGVCAEDEPVPGYAAADVWGIVFDDSEDVKVRENDVMVIGGATNATRTIGIRGNGDLALIEGNTVESYAESGFVLSTGIQLGSAWKGQILDNTIDVVVDGTGTVGETENMDAIGITAFESYKAQVTGNDVSCTLLAGRSAAASRAWVEGIYLTECDESRVSENIVFADCDLIQEPTDEEEELYRSEVRGRFTGIGVGDSDKPKILDNLVHAIGTVIARDEKTAEETVERVGGYLIGTGIDVWGLDEGVFSPEIGGNVVVVQGQAAAIARTFPDSDVEDALAGNSDLSARYAAMVQDRQGTLLSDEITAYLGDGEGLPVVTNDILDEFEPNIEEIARVRIRTQTIGIGLENVVDPWVYDNHVPVYQNVTVWVSNEPVPEGMIPGSTLPIGLIDRIFTAEQVEKAALFSLIDENGDEWQNLPEGDRAAITDAVLAGDDDVLATYAENETLFAADSGVKDALLGYRANLLDEDPFEFLNATNLAVAIPVSMNWGLYFNDTRGDMDVSGNNFTVLTNALSIVTAESDGLDAPDAAAGSIGLVAALGIGGEGNHIDITDNRILVDTSSVFLSAAEGTEIETTDAAAGSAHLLLALGISADGEMENILDNDIVVEQRSSATALALNQVKDETALSVAATAGVGVGIILDSDEVLDLGTYEPAPPELGEEFADVIRGNRVLVTDEIMVASIAAVFPESLDGSSSALSAAIGASASFGIVAPEAVVRDNVVDVFANQTSLADAVVKKGVALSAQGEGLDLPGAGAGNLGISASGGILTLRSYIANNTVFTEANSEAVVEAMTEELLEDAGVLAGIGAIDVGILSLSPSYIDANTVDGEASAAITGMVQGDRVDGGVLGLALGIGILSVGGDATFNNIYNGYLGLPYVYEEEEYKPYAVYNWWGDASGPSGLGPGTGSPVLGTTVYEPWLTRPADVVLETRDSYFGLEIGSPTIGGDGYRSGLEPGWNTLSFPLSLENNTWQAVTHTGDGLNYSVACTWDATSQKWVQVTDKTRINPLDAVYIKMNDHDRLPVSISPEITGPPARALKAGWNLVGPAYDLVELDEPIGEKFLWWGEPYGTSVVEVLASVEETPGGLTGYTVVVSPSINPEAWVYTWNNWYDEPDMDATRGYWVYMENPDTLAGFSSTPLPMPGWAWDL